MLRYATARSTLQGDAGRWVQQKGTGYYILQTSFLRGRRAHSTFIKPHLQCLSRTAFATSNLDPVVQFWVCILVLLPSVNTTVCSRSCIHVIGAVMCRELYQLDSTPRPVRRAHSTLHRVTSCAGDILHSCRCVFVHTPFSVLLAMELWGVGRYTHCTPHRGRCAVPFSPCLASPSRGTARATCFPSPAPLLPPSWCLCVPAVPAGACALLPGAALVAHAPARLARVSLWGFFPPLWRFGLPGGAKGRPCNKKDPLRARFGWHSTPPFPLQTCSEHISPVFPIGVDLGPHSRPPGPGRPRHKLRTL